MCLLIQIHYVDWFINSEIRHNLCEHVDSVKLLCWKCADYIYTVSYTGYALGGPSIEHFKAPFWGYIMCMCFQHYNNTFCDHCRCTAVKKILYLGCHGRWCLGGPGLPRWCGSCTSDRVDVEDPPMTGHWGSYCSEIPTTTFTHKQLKSSLFPQKHIIKEGAHLHSHFHLQCAGSIRSWRAAKLSSEGRSLWC